MALLRANCESGRVGRLKKSPWHHRGPHVHVVGAGNVTIFFERFMAAKRGSREKESECIYCESDSEMIKKLSLVYIG
jgi:hypothetical protein